MALDLLLTLFNDANVSNCIEWWATFSSLLSHTDLILPVVFVSNSWKNYYQYIFS